MAAAYGSWPTRAPRDGGDLRPWRQQRPASTVEP